MYVGAVSIERDAAHLFVVLYVCMYVCMIWCRIQCLLGGEARRHVRRAADHARVCRPRWYGEENVLRLLGANQVRFDPLCCMYVCMYACMHLLYECMHCITIFRDKISTPVIFLHASDENWGRLQYLHPLCLYVRTHVRMCFYYYRRELLTIVYPLQACYRRISPTALLATGAGVD